MSPTADAALPSNDIQLSEADRRELLEALANVYGSERAVSEFLRWTTYPPGNKPAGSTPYEMWEQILLGVDAGLMQAGYYQLLTRAARVYSANRTFHRLAQAYLGDRAVAPSRTTIAAGADDLLTEVPATAEDLLSDEPLACHVVIHATTEEDRERAGQMLRDLGLNPVENWSTEHAVSYTVSSGQPDHVRGLLSAWGEFSWTVVPPGQPDGLLHEVIVQGPDGRRFRMTDVPVHQLSDDLGKELLDQYFQTDRYPAVVDHVQPDGSGQRLSPEETLHEAGIIDGSTLRVSIKPMAGGRPRVDTLPEVKVVLVGEGTVGKTSLITALSNSPFEEQSRTHGIDIQTLGVRHPESGDLITLRFWDFGGQPVYRTTRPLFFSPGALYLVVWNARAGPDKDDVAGWLSQIRLRAGATASVMLVATHDDDAPDAELDYAYLEREFPGMLHGDYRVDNKSRSGILNLRAEMARQALPLTRAIKPGWTGAAEEILAPYEPQIAYQEFAAICENYGLSRDEAEELADLLHRQGRLIYHRDDETLRDLVVLDPEWSSKAIGYVLQDIQTRRAHGILDHRRLEELWQDRPDRYRYSRYHYRYLLRLMEKFDISYPMADERYSLITQLVSAARPTLPWTTDTPVPDGIRRLRVICRLSAPVPGLIAALTARRGIADTQFCWRDGTFLRDPASLRAAEALLELRHRTDLSLEVRAPSPDLYMHVLQDSIEQHLAWRWPGLQPVWRVPCPTPGDCPAQFPLAKLRHARELGKTTVTCPECLEDHQVNTLLTGFAQPASSDPAVAALQLDVSDIRSNMRDLRAHAAANSEGTRRLLAMAAVEVTDCPHLFTIAIIPAAGLAKAMFYRRQFRLTLWCEQPRNWHPCTGGQYLLKKDADWLRKFIRLARPVFTILRLAIPLANSVADALPSTAEMDYAKRELSLMKSLLDDFPDALPEDQDWVLPSGTGNPAVASGPYLRGLREMLVEVDRFRKFGDLEPVLTASGEYLWLCPEHHRTFDHSLPSTD
jgi:internalin A